MPVGSDVRSIAPSGPVDAEVSVPGSKSHTNRSLVIAALSDGPSVLEGALHSDDTEAMVGALGALGALGTLDASGGIELIGTHGLQGEDQVGARGRPS